MRQQPRDDRHHADSHLPPSTFRADRGDRLTQIVDTIVAIATPVGEAGLGVVRLSGPSAVAIASRLFSVDLANVASHTLHHGWIGRRDERLDDAVAGVFLSPRSYTGEDVVEFSCHGSPAVLRELVARCRQEGARPALPGEFTERAYLNGKIDLAQAEAVALLISARSSAAARMAANQLSGGLSRLVTDLRQRTISLVADIEANLDFVEEDIPNVDRDRIAAGIRSLVTDVDELLRSSGRGRILRDGLRVVLAGRPNVGKSSLFNALLAEDRAIVTDVPGTTRDILEAALDWDGLPVTLIDTAGLRDTTDTVEAIGTERARRAQNAADVAVLVIDTSDGVTPDDARIAATLRAPFVVALNKSDKGLSTDLAALGPVRSARTSAVNRTGLAELRALILSTLPDDGVGAESGVVVTSERHVARIAGAKAHLSSASVALGEGRSEETISSDLKAAARELSEVTGDDLSELVLDDIFRRFCVGK